VPDQIMKARMRVEPRFSGTTRNRNARNRIPTSLLPNVRNYALTLMSQSRHSLEETMTNQDESYRGGKKTILSEQNFARTSTRLNVRNQQLTKMMTAGRNSVQPQRSRNLLCQAQTRRTQNQCVPGQRVKRGSEPDKVSQRQGGTNLCEIKYCHGRAKPSVRPQRH